jgi:hypothetical protein
LLCYFFLMKTGVNFKRRLLINCICKSCDILPRITGSRYVNAKSYKVHTSGETNLQGTENCPHEEGCFQLSDLTHCITVAYMIHCTILLFLPISENSCSGTKHTVMMKT